MRNDRLISISNSSDDNKKYILRDSNGIVVGRFVIIDFDEDNKSVLIKLKYYKSGYEGNTILQEALKQMLDNLMKNKGMHKVSVICDEKISLAPFNNLGFQLEGYMSDSIINKSKYEGNLLLGIIDKDYYSNFYRKDVIIEGKKIKIKLLTPEDAEDLLDYYIRNKEFLAKFEPRREESFYTLENQKESLIENYKEFLRDEGIHFGIYKDKELVGRIRISNIIYGVFKSAFIGYSIDKEYQGNGYMKEAVALVVGYAFNELDLHRIEATTLVDNIRSQNVLKACEFEELGVCNSYLHINGKWRDHIIFYKNKCI